MARLALLPCQGTGIACHKYSMACGMTRLNALQWHGAWRATAIPGSFDFYFKPVYQKFAEIDNSTEYSQSIFDKTQKQIRNSKNRFEVQRLGFIGSNRNFNDPSNFESQLTQGHILGLPSSTSNWCSRNSQKSIIQQNNHNRYSIKLKNRFVIARTNSKFEGMRVYRNFNDPSNFKSQLTQGHILGLSASTSSRCSRNSQKSAIQ